MPHDTPVAMPNIYNDVTLEDYFKRLQEIPNVKQEVTDVQVGGNHYRRTDIQPWDIFLSYGLDPWTANVVKYILRFPYKNGEEDLAKAKHYIEYLINNYKDIHEKYYEKK